MSSSDDMASTANHHRFPHSAVRTGGIQRVSRKLPHSTRKIDSAAKRDANPMCRQTKPQVRAGWSAAPFNLAVLSSLFLLLFSHGFPIPSCMTAPDPTTTRETKKSGCGSPPGDGENPTGKREKAGTFLRLETKANVVGSASFFSTTNSDPARQSDTVCEAGPGRNAPGFSIRFRTCAT